MTIALFIYSMAGGGAERVVSYLLPYLNKQGIEVHLVLMNTTISYEIPKEINVHFLEKSQGDENGFLKLLKLPYLAYRYAQLLKKLKITHSFAFLTRPSYINILSRYFTNHRYKIIISERSHPSLQYSYKSLQSSVNNFLIRFLYSRSDSIICNSKGNANDLISNYSINKEITKVVYNPIDIDIINQVQPISNFYDKSYFNIITVGRLDTGKNHELLISSIEQVTNTRLYILGEGPLNSYLKHLVKEKKIMDRVFFLGFDNNPFKYLKTADLFVFGSNHEGFPNVLLEAMCCGLPILTTNCKSGPAEIMELKKAVDNDVMITPYGILTPIKNLKVMKKGLSYMLLKPEFRASCRINVLNRAKDFEKNHILEKYMNVILN